MFEGNSEYLSYQLFVGTLKDQCLEWILQSVLLNLLQNFPLIPSRDDQSSSLMGKSIKKDKYKMLK